ncbi:MAG: hypothetical protein N3F09_08635, partial [Bacteroidia bacterium]|nr:hypothetical protein [Bacteroidia bacterium]
MKTILLRALLWLMFILPAGIRAQENRNRIEDFHRFMQNERDKALRMGLSEAEMMEYLTAKRDYWHRHETHDPHSNPHHKPQPVFPAPTQSNGCVNIDFENGNLQGWATSCGFHPGFNAQGCCNNPGGQQTIVTGNGLDPYGN